MTTGFGEGGQGGGIDPWETGSLDKALEDAGEHAALRWIQSQKHVLGAAMAREMAVA